MLILGHRGASVAAPENTPEAFAVADAQGADGVELDVRRAPDGRLMVAHDPLPADPQEWLGVPTFDDVLDACGERMLVNVEIKNWPADTDFDPTMAMVGPVIDTLRRRGGRQRWLISSFSWDTLAACRAAGPEIATAYLCQGINSKWIEKSLAAGHAAVHPHQSTVTDSLVAECHGAGLGVNAWTCNDPLRIAELAALGVDGVCTDVPDVALAALGRAGPASDPAWKQWPGPER